ncbi:hypothetical protein GUITHDRAFT_152578 [Guillardia theta CCMP2712]|uniref:Uncharacterized protein n=1 Tax=Guillardia theta (strain CCMP2712) TaxID=905079 RepID=L1JC25_GUITC|nr:hypothetical protein GUITHDRAFT_152578 [Guillardia theta CCMP2712]EKX45837.1 hypothetical protein GUITHDRAFT_152578 [Guillardia theta CCMP2712]|mmetsp:Transcript_35138/g.109814  ORF Transcript_35138/g.109814 Transcript_35138/m.109814 type:complete len:163 (-) Transcript_35138:46-534(-)|eukprot:XP_005832817.1 hypothetical protein GUITHDRAFT_152578 [Guillardia theta CCMP2712]
MLTEVFAPTKAAERLYLQAAELPHESKARNHLKYDKETTKAFERELIARRAALENKLSESSKSSHDKMSKKHMNPIERAAWERFQRQNTLAAETHDPKRSAGPQGIVQSSRIDRPIHISSDIAHTNDTAASRLRTSEGRNSKTDTTPFFHSTMLRALAHSHT